MNEMQAHGLLIPVGSKPFEVWIDKNNSLAELQDLVNGTVDVLSILGNTVTDMVVHDMKAMQDNIGALDGMKLGDGNAIVIGKCPKCGKDLYATKNQFRCAGVHFKKTGEKDGKAVFAQDGTCDFSIYRFVGPKDKPKKLTDKNGREIAEKGKTSLIKGIKKKSGDGTYDAYLTLNRETWSLDMKFPEFKGKKHKG